MAKQTLINILKILTGRQLSSEEMANAKPAERHAHILGSDKPLTIDRLEVLPSGEFLRFKQIFEYMTTPDASHGWNCPHTGYCPSETIESTYDNKGKLTQRIVTTGNLYLASEKTIARKYSPPGRFFGKKVRIPE
jgi:hypothetical protein